MICFSTFYCHQSIIHAYSKSLSFLVHIEMERIECFPFSLYTSVRGTSPCGRAMRIGLNVFQLYQLLEYRWIYADSCMCSVVQYRSILFCPQWKPTKWGLFTTYVKLHFPISSLVRTPFQILEINYLHLFTTYVKLLHLYNSKNTTSSYT